MVNSIQSGPYGNIYRYGYMPNGRVIYGVVDSDGQSAGKLSVPNNEAKTFEKAYNDILDSASKIQKYTLENSSPEDKQKRKWTSRGTVTLGGILGAGTAILLARNSTSMTNKILSLVAGIVTGLSLGFISSLIVTSPPETFRFVKAMRQVSKLDIKKFDEIS